MRIVFWQNILSPHQSALTRAVCQAGHEVDVVVTEEMTADRLRMGWKVADFGNARITVGLGERAVESFVSQAPVETVHILAGARWTPLGCQATKQCIRLGKRLGIMSEPADDRGWRGCARWVKYTAERITSGHHFDFILAMGETGVRWFQHCGYSTRRVFPFAYLTETPGENMTSLAGAADSSSVRILYIGQCVARKAVDVLLDAFVLCADLECNLTILGDGTVKPRLEAIASAGPCRNSVRFLDAMDNQGAMLELEKADLLVLPSHFDGWGAVVNEALMRGVPVICSDCCGAADLLSESWRGEVFRTGSVPALAQALRKWIAGGRRTQETSQRIQTWSECIGGESAARYLEGILYHVYNAAGRPEAPWRREWPNLICPE